MAKCPGSSNPGTLCRNARPLGRLLHDKTLPAWTAIFREFPRTPKGKLNWQARDSQGYREKKLQGIRWTNEVDHMSICFQKKNLAAMQERLLFAGTVRLPRTLRANAAGHAPIDGILCVTRSYHALSTARNRHSWCHGSRSTERAETEENKWCDSDPGFSTDFGTCQCLADS